MPDFNVCPQGRCRRELLGPVMSPGTTDLISWFLRKQALLHGAAETLG